MLQEYTIDDVQKIIDRFHIGRIQKYYFEDFYCKVHTNQGQFIVLESLPTEWRKPIEMNKINSIPYKLKRLLLPNYLGDLAEDSSYEHFQHCYYSLFQII